MTAPTKPWESAGYNLRSSSAFPNSGNSAGLYSSSPVAPMPGTIPAARRAAVAAPPIPPRIGTAYRQTYGAPAASSLGLYGTGYGMGSYGSGYGSSYGGYGGYGTGAYGTGSYGTGAYGTGAYGTGAYGTGAYGTGAYGTGGYGTGAYGTYGGYGARSYGGYGMNRNPQHQIHSLESRFIQMAEENSRPAFESIESLVHAFGSVSFMMESTFSAIYSSFRAVLGVAENFGRLRSLFGQVFQTLAILRMFQWMYRKLLYYLGLRRENPVGETVWRQATGQLDPKTRSTFWPVAMFLSLVCAGPFLVWRLLRSLNISPPTTDSVSDPRTWVDSNGMVNIAVSLYDFTAARDTELSIRFKQGLWVAPQHLQPPSGDWLLVTHNGVQAGLVPANYVKVLQNRRLVRQGTKQAVPSKSENLETTEPIPDTVGRWDPITTSTTETPVIPVNNFDHEKESLSDHKPQPRLSAQGTQVTDVTSLNQPPATIGGNQPVEELFQPCTNLDQSTPPQPSLNLQAAPLPLSTNNELKSTS